MGIFSRKNKDNDFFEVIEMDVMSEYAKEAKLPPGKLFSDALTAQEVSENSPKNALPNFNSTSSDPLEALKSRMMNSHTKSKPEKPKKEEQKSYDNTPEKSEPQKEKPTLLERCRPYTLDDEGKDHSKITSPLYKLESVAEILRSDGEKALEQLSKKYDLTAHDLPTPKEKNQTVKASVSKITNVEKPVFYKTNDTNLKKTSDLNIFEEMFGDENFTKKDDLNIPDISDIDNTQKRTQPKEEISSNTATIRFTPIMDSKNNTDHIVVSSITRQIDISSETLGVDDKQDIDAAKTELEQTEFEEYKATEEFTNITVGKKLIKDLSIKKRNSFLQTVFSAICLLALAMFFFGPLNDMIIRNPKSAIISCGIIFLLQVIVNCNMFIEFKNVVKRNCDTDAVASLMSIAVLVLTISQITHKVGGYASNTFTVIFIASFTLFMRAITKFFKTSTILGNLKQIATKSPKKAVSFITDNATTFAMAKNSIQGDILLAAPRKTDFAADFMKYTNFGVKLGGKIPALIGISLLLSLVVGIAATLYYHTPVAGFYCVACVMSFAALPSLFLIDELPLTVASKKLNRKGAMIAGKTAAERLELANAAALSSTDIFPDGTVTLQSMKVLAENDIDHIILRAASLTEAVGSTLAPIFKQIAKTNADYTVPDSDTVKYEERLGLSGWVNNELLFIGNRTLMEAHGIEVPSIEVDKRILRKGFFPVYLASGGKACALIIIKYSVDHDIAKELHKITESGVTLLITNSDPNISEIMISDYFDIYEDSIKIISNAGVHMYNNAVTPTKICSAPAVFRDSPITFITILNCAARIKKSNTLLTIAYIIASVFAAATFTYTAFSGGDGLPSAISVLFFELAALIISIILFLLKKP